MALSEEHRKYLVRDQMVGPFVINFVLNAIIPWLSFRHQDAVSVWGSPGVVGDMVATLFILPILVCLIATPLIRKMARIGKAPAIHSLVGVPGLGPRLPGNLFVRALLLGVAVCVLVSPIVIGVLKVTGLQTVDVMSYAVVKGLVCGLVAGWISLPIAVRALAEGAPQSLPSAA